MSDQKTIPSYKENLMGLIEQLGSMLPAEQLAIFNSDAAQLATDYPSPLQLHKGDKAPAFSLTNAKGEMVSSSDLLAKGKVILTFYRGAWCPYCNLQLKQYQEVLDQIQEVGAHFVAISPQSPDNSLDMAQKNNLEFEVLSDTGNAVARQFTTVFKYSEASKQAMTDLGYDFNSFYSDDSGELPVPATFVIDQDGTVLFAASEGGDYRERVEIKDVLDVL